MRLSSPFTAARSAFTLVELMIATSVSLGLGLSLLTFANSVLTLFAKNYSINESHMRSRSVTEHSSWLLHQAVQAPTLLDQTGAAVPGDGPAGGVKVLIYASQETYRTNAVISPASTTIVLKALTSTQPAPTVGDTIVLTYQDTSAITNNSGTIQATISGVSASGGLTTLTFASALSNSFTPYGASWSIPANQAISLLTNSSLVAVQNGTYFDLRYYWHALDVATNTAATFNSSSNYRVLGQIEPFSGQATALPFTFTDAAHRLINVDVRALSTRYKGRGFAEHSWFESLHSAVAFRSAIQKTLQP